MMSTEVDTGVITSVSPKSTKVGFASSREGMESILRTNVKSFSSLATV